MVMKEHKIVEHRVTVPTTNPLAVISLVLSLFGLFATWFMPIVTQIAAIICGHIARSKIRQNEGGQTGSGMALAGLIISYLSIIFYSIYYLFFIGIGILAFLVEKT